MKAALFKFLYILIIIIALWLGIEATVSLFSKVSRLNLSAIRDEIVSMSKNEPGDANELNPVYIPHPYFGYVYIPNTRISQFNYVSNTPVYMQSNSDGFIDEEFPFEKKEGLCIYGLFGGSAAMSWGVDRREDSIAYQLEKLLNTNLRDCGCKEYRVLNLGIGSYTLYQATQVYLYYKNILDGVIFFGGFNECAQGAMLTNNDPVQFPVTNMYASLKIPSPLILRISEERQNLAKTANFLLRHPYLVYSPSVRLLFELNAEKIKELHNKLQDEGHQTTLPSIRGKFKEKLRSLFPRVTPSNFLQSYDYDNPDVPKLIEKILSLMYTDPVLDAYAVSQTANAHFLSIIQPMLFITGGQTDYKKCNFASYHFQKTCMEKLTEEARKLELYGVKTYNLNEIDTERYKKEFFIDQVHLKKEGAEVVARSLFEIIKKEWHKTE